MQSLYRALVVIALVGCAANKPRLVPPPGSSAPVDRLSALGLFDGELARQVPRAALVAYEVNAPTYADDAVKRHYVLVPAGQRIHATADRWVLPTGTYLVKTFGFPVDARDPSRGERLVETRFLVKTRDGFTAATYVWNDAQTDAIASGGDLDVPVSWIDLQGNRHDERYHVPGTSECASCHQGRALGWTSRQLDRAEAYADGTRSQIAELVARGSLDAAPPSHAVLTNPSGSGALDLRARSYLDSHCSHCHGRGGSAEDTQLLWDLEHTTPSQLPICRSTSSVDGRDRVLVPGHPERSEFLARMVSSDASVRMPRGPTHIPDRRGIELLTAWVAAMPPIDCR
jgi:uncharacterized repeat protein (TIGR03806 family)